MRPVAVVVFPPCCDRLAGVRQRRNQSFVEAFIPVAALVEDSDSWTNDPVLVLDTLNLLNAQDDGALYAMGASLRRYAGAYIAWARVHVRVVNHRRARADFNCWRQ